MTERRAVEERDRRLSVKWRVLAGLSPLMASQGGVTYNGHAIDALADEIVRLEDAAMTPRPAPAATEARRGTHNPACMTFAGGPCDCELAPAPAATPGVDLLALIEQVPIGDIRAQEAARVVKARFVTALRAALTDAPGVMSAFLARLVTEFTEYETHVHKAPDKSVYATFGLLKITNGEMRALRAALTAAPGAK